jgi:hypothetical protein
VGWNDVHNVLGCRGIQFYSSASNDMFDIHIHDNVIHDTVCDAINLATVSTNNGPIEIYNNVMYNVGKGPNPPDGSSKYTCYNLSAAGTSTSPISIYNNTCYNAGTSNGGDSSTTGGIEADIPAKLVNNIFYQTNAQPYLATTTGCTNISSGSAKNNFFGNGAAPNCPGLTNSLNVDPMVVSVSTPNFRLQSASPMVDAGQTVATLTLDQNGVTRPQGAGYDIGASEFFAGGSTVQRPNPPTNLTVIAQ